MKTVKQIELGDPVEYEGTTWQLTRVEFDCGGPSSGQLRLFAIPAMTQYNGGRKPFDLEAAKAGAPLVTRDGRKVDDLHHFTTDHSNRPVCACIGGQPVWVSVEGKAFHDDDTLFMAPKPKRTKYANLYEVGPDLPPNVFKLFDTPEEAKSAASDALSARHRAICASTRTTIRVVATAVPVEIEE